MSKELEELKSSISNWHGELKRSIGIDNIRLIKKLIDEQTLKTPTQEEVCEALNKSFNINREYTDLHFIYDKESQEFRMVSQNVVYRYISTNRLDDDAINFIDLDIEDIIILGRFYGGLK